MKINRKKVIIFSITILIGFLCFLIIFWEEYFSSKSTIKETKEDLNFTQHANSVYSNTGMLKNVNSYPIERHIVQNSNVTFHVIIVSDTNEVDRQYDRRTTYNLIKSNIKTIADTIKTSCIIYNFVEVYCTVQDLKNFLNEFTCENNDVIWFLYSGHGIDIENSKFPGLLLDITKNELIPLEDIHKILTQKNPRFLITQSGSCNSDEEFFKADDGGMEKLLDTFQPEKEILNKLFIEYKHKIIASACAEGERAVVNVNSGMNLYFEEFFKVINSLPASKVNTINWDDVFDSTEKAVKNRQTNQSPIRVVK